VGEQISSPNYISYVGASLSNRDALASTSSSYASSKEGLRVLVFPFRNGEGETAEEVNSSPAPVPEERAPAEHVPAHEQFPAPADDELTVEAQQEICTIENRLYISKKDFCLHFMSSALTKRGFTH
jgi:hypothetical protein